MSITEKMAPRVLDGRVALVTGAGQGNGRAIALGLARAGASVVATDVDTATVRQTAADIKAAGGRAWSYRLDVTNAAECTALAATVAREIGRIDLLVNNAGIVIRETFDHADAIAHAKRTFQVNVEGTLNVTHAWLADLRATKGCIVLQSRRDILILRRFAVGEYDHKRPTASHNLRTRRPGRSMVLSEEIRVAATGIGDIAGRTRFRPDQCRDFARSDRPGTACGKIDTI